MRWKQAVVGAVLITYCLILSGSAATTGLPSQARLTHEQATKLVASFAEGDYEDAQMRLGESRRTSLLALIEGLHNADQRVRLLCVRTLGKIGEYDAGPALIESLNDPYDRVRAEAAYALGYMGYEDAAMALVNAFADPSAIVRDRAQIGVGFLGDVAAPFVTAALTDKDPRMRATALDRMRFDDKFAREVFAAADDPSSIVRAVAIRIIARSPESDQEWNAIVAGMRDLDPEVRSAAASALPYLVPPSSRRPCCKILTRRCGLRHWRRSRGRSG